MNLLPLIWTPTQAEQPADELSEALALVKRFYDACGLPITLLPVTIEQMPGSIDLTAENPWNQVYPLVQGRFVEGTSLLVLLDGWTSPSLYVGWGGYPLAVVGDYALSRLRSISRHANTWADAVATVDDGEAAGLIAHEVGHCLGFGHDFSNRNIMSGWWVDFVTGTCVPSRAMVDAHREPAAARLGAASGWLEACPRPGQINQGGRV